jgi:hypothetical protein
MLVDQAPGISDSGIMPVFCPTEQVISARPKYDQAFQTVATVHGVVFQILF